MFSQISRENAGRICLAVALSTFAFTQWGYVWYAVIFDDTWQSLIGRTEGELILMASARGVMQTVFTYLISAVQVIGLLILITMARAKSFWEYQFVAVIVGVLFAVPILGNVVLFGGASKGLWALDVIHFICGYVGIAIVLYVVKYIGAENA
jgi:hypothetical protein